MEEIREKLINLLIEFDYLNYNIDKNNLKEGISLLNNNEIIEQLLEYIEENKSVN